MTDADPASVEVGGQRAELWAAYEGASEKQRKVATKRAAVLDAVERFRGAGHDGTAAVRMAAREHKTSASTVYEWLKLVRGQRRDDWVPCLLPRHKGRTAIAECSPDAWEMLKADYLRPEKPSFESCYRRLKIVARECGWTVPPATTLLRRIKREIPRPVLVANRQGDEALRRMFPPQERDRSDLHALQAVNWDGHQWDVWCEWPDGEVTRPVMVACNDLYSNKCLAFRLDKTENKELARLVLGDVIEGYGIPGLLVSDNGRAFAAKSISGGQKTRFRGKIKDEDTDGILKTLGIEVRWTIPRRGQSKPIERTFRDYCDDIARHPALAGAWAGNKPEAKPDYKVKPVPYETFRQVVADGIAEWNARPGRRTATAKGRSFDETFNESYEVSPVRKATPQQRRLWLLAVERVYVRQSDATVHLFGNRYHDNALYDHSGTYVAARYDPDDLHAGVYLYTADGREICFAETIDKQGFANADAARDQARKVRNFKRGVKQATEALVTMKPDRVAALLPKTQAPVPPDARVINPIFHDALGPTSAIATEAAESPAEIQKQRARERDEHERAQARRDELMEQWLEATARQRAGDG